MVFNTLDGHHYLFIVPPDVEWPNHAMVSLPDGEGSPVWEHQIKVFKLLSAFDNRSHSALVMHLVEGV